jgi:hypothetical protein
MTEYVCNVLSMDNGLGLQVGNTSVADPVNLRELPRHRC